MNAWLVHLAAYLGAYAAIVATTYALTPLIGRRLIALVVLHAYQGFCSDTRQKMAEHLASGRKKLIPPGQAAIVGHLVEPYVEKLGQWMAEKINEHGHDRVVGACTEACVRQLLRWRVTIALAAAQVATGLVAIGFIARGLLTQQGAM